jgi:hypothetical protein
MRDLLLKTRGVAHNHTLVMPGSWSLPRRPNQTRTTGQAPECIRDGTLPLRDGCAGDVGLPAPFCHTVAVVRSFRSSRLYRLKEIGRRCRPKLKLARLLLLRALSLTVAS